MIPRELQELRQWVCAWDDSKVPMSGLEPGQTASTSNPATWCEYRIAQNLVDAGLYDNVGFVFHNNLIVGIDIDCGWNDDGLLSDVALDIISRCHSYTEQSRSGRGFHILVRGYLPFDGKNNQNGVEIYQTKRYFILTGKTVPSLEDIVENQEAIDYVVQRYFPAVRTERETGPVTERIYNPLWQLPKPGKVQMRPEYPKIGKGSRNICMTSLAGMLHTQGYTKGQIYEELRYANETACDPKLDDRELKQIAASITRYKR